MRADAGAAGGRATTRLLHAVTLLLAVALWGAVWPGPLASTVLQTGAVLTLVAVLGGAPAHRPAPVLSAGLAVLALTPWLYLLPLPAAWLADLGARALYATPSAWLGQPGPDWAPLSMAPFATWAVALDLLVPLAVFLAVRTLGPDHHARLLGLLLALAVAEGLFGLLQYASASSGSGWLPVQGPHAGSATGSYANRNHLALLLEMLLPLAVLLTLNPAAGTHPDGRPDRTATRHRALRWGVVAGMLLVCLLFTRSRTGITLALLGVVLALALGRHPRRRGGTLGFVSGILVLALGVASVIGLAPVIARFGVDALVADARLHIYSATLETLRSWWPLGSGPGTYALVMPPTQPLTLPDVVLNHAHNDYLEVLVETGALGALLLSAALGAFMVQSYREVRRAAGPLSLGAGLGLLLVASHELLDYGLQIPLNQVVFAVLAGVFFPPPAAAPDRTPDLPPRHATAPRRPRPPAPDLNPSPARTGA